MRKIRADVKWSKITARPVIYKLKRTKALIQIPPCEGEGLEVGFTNGCKIQIHRHRESVEIVRIDQSGDSKSLYSSILRDNDLSVFKDAAVHTALQGEVYEMSTAGGEKLPAFTVHRLKQKVAKHVSLVEVSVPDRLETSITLQYGAGHWDKPSVIFTDIFQNHIDESKNVVIEVIVRNAEGNLIYRPPGGNGAQDIIGLRVSDDGKGFSPDSLQFLGKTTKNQYNRGQHGEGLKMVALAALRQGLELRFSSQGWSARPVSSRVEVKSFKDSSVRHIQHDVLGFELSPENSVKPGSSTEIIFCPKITRCSTEDAELWKNLVAHNLLPGATLLFTNRPDYRSPLVEVATDRRGSCFQKGIYVYQLDNPPLLFSYNFLVGITETRERNVVSPQAYRYLRDFYANHASVELISAILKACAEKPDEDRAEYRFLISVPSSILQTAFRETFGDDALLSMNDRREAVVTNSNLITLHSEARHCMANAGVATLHSYNARATAVQMPSPAAEDISEFTRTVAALMRDIVRQSAGEMLDWDHDPAEVDMLLSRGCAVQANQIRLERSKYTAGSFGQNTDSFTIGYNHRALTEPFHTFVRVASHELSHLASSALDFTDHFNKFRLGLAFAGLQGTSPLLAHNKFERFHLAPLEHIRNKNLEAKLTQIKSLLHVGDITNSYFQNVLDEIGTLSDGTSPFYLQRFIEATENFHFHTREKMRRFPSLLLTEDLQILERLCHLHNLPLASYLPEIKKVKEEVHQRSFPKSYGKYGPRWEPRPDEVAKMREAIEFAESLIDRIEREEGGK